MNFNWPTFVFGFWCSLPIWVVLMAFLGDFDYHHFFSKWCEEMNRAERLQRRIEELEQLINGNNNQGPYRGN